MYTITDKSSLTMLETHLKDNPYIGGNFPNHQDAQVSEQFQKTNTVPNQETHINIMSWYSLIYLYADHVKESWKSTKPQEILALNQEKPKTKKKEEKAEIPTKKADSDPELFCVNEDDVSVMKELAKKKEDEKKTSKYKPPVIAKSFIILHIKVWDGEVDYDAVAQKIFTIERDGLLWKTEYQLKDVAFGVKMIVIGVVVEDEKVSIDDVIEEIEGWIDDVQFVDIPCINYI
jgi:elongation factor 1-beta